MHLYAIRISKRNGVLAFRFSWYHHPSKLQTTVARFCLHIWYTWVNFLIWCGQLHDDVIKWKHFPRNWPFVQGIHRSRVNSPHKGQWRGALMFSLIGVWINACVNNREAGDLRRYRAHYDVTVMWNELSVRSGYLKHFEKHCVNTKHWMRL